MAQLLVRLGWRWVGVVRGDHAYGRFALQGLLRELSHTEVCVAYQEMIPLLYDRDKALEIMQVDTLADTCWEGRLGRSPGDRALDSVPAPGSVENVTLVCLFSVAVLFVSPCCF